MGLLGQVNNLMQQTPQLQFNIPPDQGATWQLTTYVDSDTRISRGDGGSVFVFVRDVSIN